VITASLPKVVFTQYWQGVEWAAKQVFADGELAQQVRGISEPNTLVCSCLSNMHDAFYPNELHGGIELAQEHVRSCGSLSNLRYDRFLPWVMHQALRNLRTDDGTIDASWSKNGSSQITYDDVIGHILQQEWLLSWHWRALLPSARGFPFPAGRVLVIQISHIRKWEMLLCYTVPKDALDNQLIGEIPLRSKDLCRAPVFGLSHRLRGWDTYRLFYQDRVLNAIREEDADARRSHLPRRLAAAYVVGRHDCYYIVENMDRTDTSYTWTLRPYIEMTPEKALIDRHAFGSDAFYYRSTDLVDMPSFDHEHEGIPQLLSSDSYCDAILELTEVLNDPTAKSVLLIAPPGSGKEKLAESAYYCRERGSYAGRFVATTLAGLTASEAAMLLFAASDGSVDGPPEADPRANPLDCYVPAKYPKNGLVLQALGGALFIDEIDKTDQSVRSMLLRLLESDELTIPGTSQVLKIPRERVPLYIFAGSMSRPVMLQERPIDFWTRISHVIEVAHPLAIYDMERSRKVVRDYLWMFWCTHVKKFMESKVARGTGMNDATPSPLEQYYRALYLFLIDRTTVSFATDALVDQVSGRGKPLASIRTLRSIVARAVYKFVDALLYSKSDVDALEVLKAEQRDVLRGTVPSLWFSHLSELIRRANCRNSDAPAALALSNLESDVVDSLRTAIRAGAVLVQ
jgi:hypothetical protein